MRVSLLLGGICLAAAALLAGENVVPNGDFENGSTGWSLWEQTPGTAKAEPCPDDPHTGRFSLRVANPGKGGANLYSQDIPCEPNASYTITVWAKTVQGRRAAVALWGLDGNGKTLQYAIGRSTPVPDNLPRYMRFSREVTTPADCRRLRAHLTNSGGTVYWDSVEVRKGPLCMDHVVPAPPTPQGLRNLIPNSGFEEGKRGWRFWRGAPGNAADGMDTAATHSGASSYRVTNLGKEGANVYSEDIPCTPKTTYTISAYVKTQGANRCSLSVWTLRTDGETISYSTDGAVDIPADLNEFTRFTKTFATGADATAMRAHLVQNGGAVWWDDVQIETGTTATEYQAGPSILEAMSVGRAEAIQYTRAILHHAQASDLCEQAERAARYAARKADTGPLAQRIAAAQQQLAKAEELLQADRIAPDFTHLDYVAAESLLGEAESAARAALGDLAAMLGEAKFLPSMPQKLEGPVTPGKLAGRFIMFPLLGMGRCGTAFFDGTYDWRILAPFGFEAVGPFVHGEGSGGRYDFAAADEQVDSAMALGILADIQTGAERAVRSQLKDRLGEEIYLHAADGRWSEQGNCHQVINIWHPDVRRVNNEYFEALGRNFRDNPTILCYELINEPSLHIERPTARFCADPIGPGGYSKAARAAWPVYLQKRYGSIDKLNARWGSSYPDFPHVEPPADLKADPPSQFPAPSVPLAIEFNRFRAQSHDDYFRESLAALRRGDPNHPILPQFIASTGPRVECACDLLGLSSAGWDLFSTHDWPGDEPAVTCLYAYSINRYIRLPMWEDEFIYSQWAQKGVDPRLVRPVIARNLWRQVAWGKRGIHLFNLENEWRAGYPDNWNNSILNVEAESKIVRFETGAIKVVKDRAERVAPLLFETEIEPQGIAILQPTSTLYSGIARQQSSQDSTRICSWLLAHHRMPFFVPEECILDGREDLSRLRVIIAPMAVCVPRALEEKLRAWVEGGGVLVTSGPFSAYDDEGKRSLELMSGLLGVADAAYDSGAWRVRLKDGRVPAPGEVISGPVGKGKVWWSVGRIARPDNPDALPLAQVMAETFPVPPVACDNEKVEMILRRDPNGTRYLCAIHLEYGAPVETQVRVAGAWSDVVDLTVGEGTRVPVETAGDVTVIPLHLAPGGAAILRLAQRAR